MKYSRNLLIVTFAIVLFIGASVELATAQRVTGGKMVRRPVVVQRIYRRPYYGYGYLSGWYDPFYDPYFNDPYLRERRQQYYLQRDVSSKRKDLRKKTEKYNKDGVVTAEEQEKLDKKEQKLAKAEQKLDEFNEDRAD